MSTLMQISQNSQDISSLDISNQPEMESKKEPKNKRIYIKFSAENLVRLNELYEKRTYPTKKEMRKLSLVSQEPLKKLENWFKHKRRTDIKNGLLKFSKKKIFSQADKTYLMRKFMECRKPNYSDYKTMSKELKCPIKHLKNWFCYKRKVYSNESVPTENFLANIKKDNKDMVSNEIREIPLIKQEKEIEQVQKKDISLKTEEISKIAMSLAPEKQEEITQKSNSIGFNQMLSEYQRIQYQYWMMAATLNQNMGFNYGNKPFQFNQNTLAYPNMFPNFPF